jgi:hypothetical protein
LRILAVDEDLTFLRHLGAELASFGNDVSYGDILDAKWRHYLTRIRAGAMKMDGKIDGVLPEIEFGSVQPSKEEVGFYSRDNGVGFEAALASHFFSVCTGLATTQGTGRLGFGCASRPPSRRQDSRESRTWRRRNV